MKRLYPNLYREYIQKYKDHTQRENLLTRKIPKLECLWNDVVHFLPLHPYEIYKVSLEIGINLHTNKLFYKVPISALKGQCMAIYKYSKHNWGGPNSELKQLNICTKEYYREEYEKGRRFGMFHLIPHVLVKGKVEVKNIEIINWSIAPVNG